MGYDSHFVLDALVKIRKKKDMFIKVLPKNEQQYRAIYARRFAFLDSYQFLFASLDALMKDYVQHKSPDEMTIINQSKLAKDKNQIFSSLVNLDWLIIVISSGFLRLT